MMTRLIQTPKYLALTFLFIAQLSQAGDLDEAIARITSVGTEGLNNEAASRGYAELVQSGEEAIVPILSAMKSASPVAANWLRAAVEAIVDNTLAHDGSLPTANIGDFLLDTRQSPQARRLAFELIAQTDPNAASALVAGFLNDPATELKYDAVEQLLDQGLALKEADKAQAASIVFRQALNAARDVTQVQSLATHLRELGRTVDLPTHFGFLMDWNVIGPFDNTDREGFQAIFSPETDGFKATASYAGKEGDVQWQTHSTKDDFGMLDMNEPYGMLKEVTGFAYTTFESSEARSAQIRLGCKNAWKIWLNGDFVFGRDEYHRGMRVDQYTLPIELKKGTNGILVKVCQNEQTQDWTKEWCFQLRICDETGAAILSTDRKTRKPDGVASL